MLALVAMFAFAACGSSGGDPGTDTTPGTDLVKPDVWDGGTDLFHPSDPGPPADNGTDPGTGEDTMAPDISDPGGSDIVDVTEVDGGDWSENYGKACLLSEKIGEFRILIDDGNGFSWIQGHVSDAVEAQAEFTDGDQEGGCILKMPVNPFCNPPCDPGTVCNKDSECMPEPDRVDVGTVSFTGLSVPVVIQPDWNFGYSKFDFTGDAYATGAQIELVAEGGDLEGFTLQGAGVDRLEVPFTELDMGSGLPLTIEWTPSDGPGVVFVEIDMTQHGITPVNLYCEVEDTGSLTVSANLMTQVIGSWMEGIPILNLYRHTIDSVDLSLGCVEFEVFHEIRTPLNIL